MPRRLAAPGACVGAGLALALSLPKPGLSSLAWLAVGIPFAAAASARRARDAAALFAATGAGCCGLALYWIYSTCRFAGVPVPVAALAWAALCAFLSLHWALYGALSFRLRTLDAAARPWAAAALWAGLEWAWSRTPRVPIDLLAYTQSGSLFLLQGCSVLGPHALSFLLILWGACAAALWEAPRGRVERRNAVAAFALFALWSGGGAWSLARRVAPTADGPRVEILQPNVNQYKKWDPRYAGEILATLQELLLRPRAAPPDLVVWPEAALPGWLEEPTLDRWVGDWARRLKAPMLVGTVSAEGGVPRNSGAWIGADGNTERLYHKRQLVPFGEFVPFRRVLQPWIGILSEMGDMAPGPESQALFSWGGRSLGVSICYEAAFPRWMLSDARRGARVFVNLTNDGWYKDTWAPYQHFQANVFRAVESRAFVVRAANTGISGLIDPWGEVLAETRLGEAGRLDARLPVSDPFPAGSFYSRHGELLGPACLLLGLLFLAPRSPRAFF